MFILIVFALLQTYLTVCVCYCLHSCYTHSILVVKLALDSTNEVCNVIKLLEKPDHLNLKSLAFFFSDLKW